MFSTSSFHFPDIFITHCVLTYHGAKSWYVKTVSETSPFERKTDRNRASSPETCHDRRHSKPLELSTQPPPRRRPSGRRFGSARRGRRRSTSTKAGRGKTAPRKWTRRKTTSGSMTSTTSRRPTSRSRELSTSTKSSCCRSSTFFLPVPQLGIVHTPSA